VFILEYEEMKGRNRDLTCDQSLPVLSEFSICSPERVFTRRTIWQPRYHII